MAKTTKGPQGKSRFCLSLSNPYPFPDRNRNRPFPMSPYDRAKSGKRLRLDAAQKNEPSLRYRREGLEEAPIPVAAFRLPPGTLRRPG